MSDELFKQGQKVWVQTEQGAIPAIWVGEGENATFFGGPPLAYVVLEQTREGVEVPLDEVTPRDE